jgi:ATP-dependent HslUV protease subunit HslV
MSIIVAVRKGREIALAADSQTNFGSVRVRSDNHRAVKFRSVGPALLATTGWGLYENILEDFLKRQRRTPSLSNKLNIFAFFMKLWDEMHDRYTLVNDQCNKDDPSPFGDLDASFIVVNKLGIFGVACDLSVTEFKHYHAIGSGCDFALGAMHALYETKMKADEIARRAIEAAVTFNVYCGGEIEIKKVTARER